MPSASSPPRGMRKPLRAKTARARRLRRDATDVERRLWFTLRERLPAWKFRRQHPIGERFADFACPSHKLAIELDGGQHALQQRADDARRAALARRGYRVVRFWNIDVIDNLEGVLETIRAALERTPQRGGGGGDGRKRRKLIRTLRSSSPPRRGGGNDWCGAGRCGPPRSESDSSPPRWGGEVRRGGVGNELRAITGFAPVRVAPPPLTPPPRGAEGNGGSGAPRSGGNGGMVGEVGWETKCGGRARVRRGSAHGA